ncbi:hypothetical protein [Streptomyces sp. S465]|uniref:hypothetical protein n=1 Tax=Streptomyces sp. S465 TaxID=2979468 RepID=UPI0022A859CD|nr:hypothetical protein [Streptomyces sp. S465]WAP56325.1 hypothetical protein N6H00_15885 [Streptomyces sp. S465]
MFRPNEDDGDLATPAGPIHDTAKRRIRDWMASPLALRRVRKTTIAALLSALVSATLLLWVDSRPSVEKREGCDRGATCSGGDHFEAQLDRARKQLFTGRLDYTKPSSLRLTVGKPSYFRAAVLGTWVVKKEDVQSEKVTVGGQVTVSLHCSGVATCTPISSKRQSVTDDPRFKDGPAWVWEVTPKEAGTVYFALTVTSYYENTTTVLYEKPPITADAEVKEARKEEGATSWVADAYGWFKKMIEELALIAAGLATVLGLWLAWKTRNSYQPTGSREPPQGTVPTQPTQPGQAQSPTSTTARTGPTAGDNPPSDTR